MTLDPASELRLSCLYPDIAVRARRVIEDFRLCHGLQLKCAQGIRSMVSQLEIWKKGRELRPDGVWVVVDPHQVVTDARPGDSWHHFSAVDLCFAGTDPFLSQIERRDHARFELLWSEVARFGEAHGFESGSRWKKKDRPHLELRYGGMTLAEAKQIFAHGGLRGVWSRFDQIRGVAVGSEWDRLEMRERLKAQGIDL